MSTLTRFPSIDSYKGTFLFPSWRLRLVESLPLPAHTVALDFFEQHKSTLISEGSQQVILLAERSEMRVGHNLALTEDHMESSMSSGQV